MQVKKCGSDIAQKHSEKKILWPALVLALTLMTMIQSQNIDIKDSTLYSGLKQEAREMKTYRYSVGPTKPTLQIAITIEPDDAMSDPDIFISKVGIQELFISFLVQQNQINSTDYQYDMQCSKAGSDVCILKKGYATASDSIYISIRCLNACQFSMKINQVSVTSLVGTNQPQISRLQIESRSVTAFSYQIPSLASDGTTVDYVLFQVDPLLTTTPISLYLSTSDDLSMIEEKEVDNIVETAGKSIRFSSTDQGWCVGCTVYLILNAKAGGTFTVTTKSQSRRDLLQDQVPLSKTFATLKGPECLTYPVIASSNNDVVINIRTQQGDMAISVVNKNATLEQSIAYIDVIPIQSSSALDSPLKQLIIRNVYRQKFLNVLPTMSLCFNAYKTSTVLIQTIQRKNANKFDLIEDTMTTFTLDSKDFIYFRFTSLSLTLPNQTITITMQASNLASALLTPPKLAYRICQSAIDSECTLTDTLAFTAAAPMSTITGVVDTLTSIRTATINHMPSLCVDPYSCHYLISVYNPDTTGLMRVSLKASLSQQNVQPIRLFQEYIGQVEMNQYQYFQVAFTPQQVSFLKIATIKVKLTSYNGQTELYASNKIRNPQYNMSEFSSTSTSSINQLSFNVSQVKDLSNYTLYIGVFGQASMATYQLKIDGDYVSNQTTTPVQPDITPIRQPLPPPQIRGTLMQEKTPVTFTLDTGNTTSKINFTYQVPQGMLTNRSLKTTFVVCKILKSFSSDVSFFYNVTFRNTSLNQQGQNTSFTMPIDSTLYDYDNLDQNVVYAMFEIRSKNATGLDISKQKVTLQLAAFTVDNNLQASSLNTISVMPNQTYFGFLRGGKYAVFRTPLMDSNSTHRFILNNIIGSMTLKIKHANGLFDYSKMAISTNDSFYDYASSDPDWQDQQLIGVTQKMRESVNPQCRNASAFLNGGNSNCTIYSMVKCEDLVCLFNQTDLVTSPFNGRGGIDSPPFLLSDQTPQDLTVERFGSVNFYIPYIIQQISGDRAIHLNKSNGVDSYIVGRIITNAYLPYQQWKYPTNTSYDFISKSSTNNEVIDLPRTNLTSKCPNNTSCAVLISIIGNAPQGSIIGKNATSSFRVTYLTESDNLPSNSVVQSTLVPQTNVAYDYYWFTINTKPKGVSYKWVQNLILKRDNSGPKVDMFLSLFDGRLPTSEDFDYKSTMIATDYLQISSEDMAFTKFNQQSAISRLLVIVGVKRNSTFIRNTTYTLMNWGPTPLTDAPVNITDLSLGRATSFAFQPRTSIADNSQYRVLRFFSYGLRDLQFNITCTEGQVLVLAGSQPFKNLGNQNIFLNIPLFPETSKLTPTVVTKNQSLQLRMTNSNAQTSGFFCTFCWYYITIISNSSNLATKSAAIVNVTELKDVPSQTSALTPGFTFQNIYLFAGVTFQFTMSIPTKNPFLLNMSFTQGFNVSATIGLYSDKNNPVIWSSSSVNGNLALQVKQNDNRFDIGNQYYVTLINNYKIQGTKIPVNITLTQNNDINFLKQGRTVDRMWNNNDYVKFYYLMAPAVFVNYTALITIQSKTPGMIPIIQALRNDMIGNQMPLTSMKYPSFTQYTQSYEKPFYQTFNQTTAFSLPLSNKIINQPVSQVVNGVVKNSTIQLTNQTFFTIALYWVNHGFTDFQKAEYEIFVKLTPVTGKLLSAPSEFQLNLKQHVIMQRILKNNRTQEKNSQSNLIDQN